jgi:uncharacterized membrane protein YfcA
MDPLDAALIGSFALLGSIVGAIAGFGTGIIMLPILVFFFGIRESIPILTVAMLLTNGSRSWFNRTQITLPVVFWFALGAAPAAILGGLIFATAPAPALVRVLGVYLLLMVVYRHSKWQLTSKTKLWHFTPLGASTSLVSALVGVSGPLIAPFFLGYGLMKGAYIGTDALATVTMQSTRLAVFGGLDLVTEKTLLIGVGIGAVTFMGTYVGKRLLDILPERYFPCIIEATMLASGLRFLIWGTGRG